MKRTTALIICLIMLAVSASAEGITVEVDSVPVVFDSPVKIINGRTMVPVRAVFESLGAEVTWDGEKRTVYAKRDGKNISMTIGENRLFLNGLVMPMDVSAVIMENRTYVPARFAAESMGYAVSWDSQECTVRISTDVVSDARCYRVYENQLFSVLYPDGWNTDISFGDIIFIDNQGDKTDDFGMGMISLSATELVKGSFSDTVSARYDYLISDCGAELSEFRNTTVNGCAAAYFSYTDKEGDHVNSYVVSGNTRAYFIEFISETEGVFDEIYENVLNSFTIF